MGFEIRKKRKHIKVEEFIKEIKKIYEEAKAVLRKSQKEMKKKMWIGIGRKWWSIRWEIECC